MKVIEDSPDRLVLKSNPWLLAVALFAGAVVLAVFSATGADFAGNALAQGQRVGTGIGAVVVALLAVIFGTVETVVLDRPAGLVAWRRRNVLGVKEDVLPLCDVRGVQVAVHSKTSRKSKRTYRVEFRLEKGARPVSRVYSSGRSAKDELAGQIESWLAAPATA